ncbi:MAG: thioredoxin [Candidatus Thermoplasmatota archaeon]|nr:thioredoxin [Candidatus Thermoplasmatota archaeon]
MKWPKRRQNVKKTIQKVSPKNDWPDSVVTLNENSMDEFIHRYPFVVIDFWAPWCAPCKTMGPQLRRLSKIYQGKIAFGKLDINTYETIAKQYRIQGIPHLIFFQHGKKLLDITGVRSISALEEITEKCYRSKY